MTIARTPFVLLRMYIVCAAATLVCATQIQTTLAAPEVDEVAVESTDEVPNEHAERDAVPQKRRTFHDITRERPFAVELQAAQFGSPIGLLGMGVEVSVFPALAAYAGVGQGGKGTQWAVGLRPRLLPGGDGLTITTTLAYSQGEFKPFELTMAPEYSSLGTTSWFNADIGPEYRSEGGILFRVSGGYSQAVASEFPPEKRGVSTSLPGLVYVALAFGVHF